MKRLFFMIALLFITPHIGAQEDSTFTDSRPVVLGVSFDYGILLKHTESLREMPDSYPVAIQLDLSKHLITKRSMEVFNCFPRVGLSVAYWNWDNPHVLGSGLTVVGYIEPYLRTHKRTNYFFRLGLGGVYLTDPYDEFTNPLNQSYSMHLSYFMEIGTGVNYRLNDKLNLRFAAKYNHVSNGGKREPNKGINLPSVNIGINTSFVPITFPVIERDGKREPPDKRHRISLTHFSGWSNASLRDKDKFYVFGFSAKYSRWIGGRSALTGGTEWIVDYSKKEKVCMEGRDSDFQQGAIFAGHEFWLGKVTFSQEFGFYYYREFCDNDDVYQRYGLTYDIIKPVFVGMNVKARVHEVDFFDFRVGCRF